MAHTYPPPHMTCLDLVTHTHTHTHTHTYREERLVPTVLDMYPPPHMTHMYPPPHMTHMYPPPHMTHMLYREERLVPTVLDRASFHGHPVTWLSCGDGCVPIVFLTCS